MALNADEETYTADYPSGSWIECELGGEKAVGLVTKFDESDGQYYVTVPPKKDGEDWDDGWIEHDEAFRPAKPAISTSGTPEHIFVLLYEDDMDEAQVEVFADPETVVANLPANAPSEIAGNLQLKLMEAVADPGEWVTLTDKPAGFAISFRSVTGAER